MTITFELLGIFFSVALIAGFIDAIAGGGGLITIPVLLLFQIPPLLVLGTNKVQGTFGTLAAALTMFRKRIVQPSSLLVPFLCALSGSIAGALTLQFVSLQALDLVVPIVLVAIALYFAVSPTAGAVEGKARLTPALYNFCVVPLIGFYDGIFGPGAGSFFSVSGVALRGLRLIEATGNAKFLNFATNLAAATVFVMAGKVIWPIAAAMIAGQILGATIGSMTAIKGGVKIIRPLTITVCLAMTARYLWQKGFLPF